MLSTEHEIAMLSWFSCKHPWQKAHDERFVFSPLADQCMGGIGGPAEPRSAALCVTAGCSWAGCFHQEQGAAEMGTPQVMSSGRPYLLVTEGLPTSR